MDFNEKQGLDRRGFLAGTAAVAAGATVLGTGTAVAKAGRAAAGGTAYTHATVIDPGTGRVLRDRTVVVRGTRITAVGYDVPRGVEVVDLRGKYVIPGLADMHTHQVGDERIWPALYVANGVTTIREMSGSPDVYAARARIESGALLGPRMIAASNIIDGSPTLWDPNLIAVEVAGTPAEGRESVRRVAANGADFVKVYSRLHPDTHRAVADEARRHGLTIAGHLPDEVPATRASEIGQRSFEHSHSMALAVSSQDAEIRRRLRSISTAEGDYNAWFDQYHPIEWLAHDTFSPTRAAVVFGTLRHNRTRVVPTLAMHNVLDHPDDVSPDDPRLKYLPADTLAVYDYVLDALYRPRRTPEDKAQQPALFRYRQRFAAAMIRAGVPVMAGTDTGTPYCFPGFSLHDELELMVRGGVTPLEALRTATTEPARFLGRPGELGTVRPGAIADLLVLDANPLADIRNTQRIHSVSIRGRYIGPDERAGLLDAVEAAAQQPSAAPARAGCACTTHPH